MASAPLLKKIKEVIVLAGGTMTSTASNFLEDF
jgi:hypothetical protein